MGELMKQHGMALVVALVITLIIGIIAIAVGKTALQENQQSATGEFDTLASYTQAQSGMNRAEPDFRDTVVTDKTKIYSGVSGSISTAIDEDSRLVAGGRQLELPHSDLDVGSWRLSVSYRTAAICPAFCRSGRKEWSVVFRVTSRAVGPGGSVTTLQSYIGVLAQKKE